MYANIKQEGIDCYETKIGGIFIYSEANRQEPE
jgi:hypothetical protein